MQSPSSGSIALQEYRRDIPPGWIPGNASYPLGTYFGKLSWPTCRVNAGLGRHSYWHGVVTSRLVARDEEGMWIQLSS